MKKKILDDEQFKHLRDLNIECLTIEDLLDVLPSHIKIVKSDKTNSSVNSALYLSYCVLSIVLSVNHSISN